MTKRAAPGAKFFPAPWTYEAHTVNGRDRVAITNTHFWLLTDSEDFAASYVDLHNQREGWPS